MLNFPTILNWDQALPHETLGARTAFGQSRRWRSSGPGGIGTSVRFGAFGAWRGSQDQQKPKRADDSSFGDYECFKWPRGSILGGLCTGMWLVDVVWVAGLGFLPSNADRRDIRARHYFKAAIGFDNKYLK